MRRRFDDGRRFSVRIPDQSFTSMSFVSSAPVSVCMLK
jgi:hypothetical protein